MYEETSHNPMSAVRSGFRTYGNTNLHRSGDSCGGSSAASRTAGYIGFHVLAGHDLWRSLYSGRNLANLRLCGLNRHQQYDVLLRGHGNSAEQCRTESGKHQLKRGGRCCSKVMVAVASSQDMVAEAPPANITE